MPVGRSTGRVFTVIDKWVVGPFKRIDIEALNSLTSFG